MRLPYIIEIHANPGFPQSNSSNRKSVHPIVPPIRIRFCLHEGFAPSSHLHNLVCGHFGSCADREWDLCRQRMGLVQARNRTRNRQTQVRFSNQNTTIRTQFSFWSTVHLWNQRPKIFEVHFVSHYLHWMYFFHSIQCIFTHDKAEQGPVLKACPSL